MTTLATTVMHAKHGASHNILAVGGLWWRSLGFDILAAGHRQGAAESSSSFKRWCRMAHADRAGCSILNVSRNCESTCGIFQRRNDLSECAAGRTSCGVALGPRCHRGGAVSSRAARLPDLSGSRDRGELGAADVTHADTRGSSGGLLLRCCHSDGKTPMPRVAAQGTISV